MDYEEMKLAALMGESSRGPQDADVLGFTPGTQITPAHVATMRKLKAAARSRNMQSSNLGVIGTATATATGSANPINATNGLSIAASIVPQKNYKPLKLMVGLEIVATDSASTPVTNAVFLSGPGALYLIGAASCGDNLFPVNPGVGFGAGSGAVSCSAYPNNGIGNGISWKEIWAFGTFQINFVATPTVIYSLPTWSPSGLVTYTFRVTATVFGPMWDAQQR
jgi:hypothetical protein